MDILKDHRSYRRFYYIKNNSLGVLLFLLLAFFSILGLLYFKNNISTLNEYSGSATILLTLVLVLITGYYSIVTHKMLSNEIDNKLKLIQPNLKLYLLNFNIQDIASDDTDLSSRWSLQFKIKNYNAIAIDLVIDASIPYEYLSSNKKYEYLICRPKQNIHELDSNDSLELDFEGDVCSFDLSENTNKRPFVVVNIKYEDRDGNLYVNNIYYWVRTIGHRPSVLKVYEEIELLKSKYNNSLMNEANESSPDPEKTVVIKKKSRFSSPFS